MLLSALLPVQAQEAKTPDIPAAQLVRLTVDNEVNDGGHSSVKHLFRARRQTPKGSQTRVYVETSPALAGMLIAVNDKPLPPQQRQAEINHLAWLEGDPEALRKKHAREKEDTEHTMRIMKALPDAFRYEYAGAENGSAQVGHQGRPLARLTFRPNPAYSPPTRVEQVLMGMEGYLLIDAESHRIAKIDGTLFKEVSFGWGLIGHLNKGSQFSVQQADVGEGEWEITEMKLDITGKILLVKGLSLISDEVYSDFQRVPDELSFKKGIALLKTEEDKFARSSSPEESPKIRP